MTDADVDGAHIRTLLLTFFYRQMLPLVEGGYVYIGQPPLYRLGRGKKEKYFMDDHELNIYLFEQASAQMKVTTELGVVFENQDLFKVLQRLTHYQKITDYLARINIWEELNKFLLDKNVISADQFEDEAFVVSLKEGLSEQNLNLGNIRTCRWRPSCYEFDAAIKDKGHIVITVGPQIPLINEYRQGLGLYPEIKDLLIGSFSIDTGSKVIPANNWHELIESVKNETFKGSSLQRYKGLGEMNPDQLWGTTMDPEKRTLLQVTIDDAEAADDIFTTLMGDKVEPRRDFIQTHALEVSSLDV
jgi:DNA gyrase subunit B